MHAQKRDFTIASFIAVIEGTSSDEHCDSEERESARFIAKEVLRKFI